MSPAKPQAIHISCNNIECRGLKTYFVLIRYNMLLTFTELEGDTVNYLLMSIVYLQLNIQFFYTSDEAYLILFIYLL